MDWISVKDRMPEDDPAVKKYIEKGKFGFLTVLVHNGVVKQTNRFYCNEERFGLHKTDGWEWASSNVTHWMPLPEPPKEAVTMSFKCQCGRTDGNDDQVLRRRIKEISYNGNECIISELRKCDICGKKRWIDLHYKLNYKEASVHYAR